MGAGVPFEGVFFLSLFLKFNTPTGDNCLIRVFFNFSSTSFSNCGLRFPFLSYCLSLKKLVRKILLTNISSCSILAFRS